MNGQVTSGVMKADRIQRVVIVGGGTAGWMAALYINRFMRRMNGKVIVVELPTIGTIGVGEATIPTLVHFIRLLNLDENELMRRCSATYKLAIKFEDWIKPGLTYWHPFGVCGRVNGLDLFHFWLKRRFEAGSKFSYTDYSVQAHLAQEEKSPWPYGGTSPIFDAGGYAYHLDAAALGDYLRELSTAEGVEHLFGTVQDVELDRRGYIANLKIGGDRTIAGDLFIDATGFGGRLIGQALGDPWIDWSRYMLCDKAVAMPLVRDEHFPPYTLSKALPAGWMWRITLEQPHRQRLRLFERASFRRRCRRDVDRTIRYAPKARRRSAVYRHPGRPADELLVAQLCFDRACRRVSSSRLNRPEFI